MKQSLNDQTGELVALAREGRLAAVVDRALGLPAADVGDLLASISRGAQCRLLVDLPSRLAARALAGMPRDACAETTLAALPLGDAVRLIAELDDGDAAALLSRMTADDRQPILDSLANRGALGQRMQHRPGTAGALMTSRLVSVNQLDSIPLAIEAVRRQAAAIGDVTEIFVIDTSRRLTGLLPMSQLLVAPATSIVRDIMTPGAVNVSPTEGQDLVARVIARYALTSVPVVDGAGCLVGRVTADVVRAVAVDEVTADLLRFGGVAVGGQADGAWTSLVRSRLPMLYAALVPAFAAAAVVFFFKGAVARIVALAVWLPVVAAIGGNAGIQSLATAIRRQLLQPERRERLRSILLREAAIGSLNGIAIGLIVSVVAVLLGETWKLALVVLVATTANLATASVIGAIIPASLKRLGRDPALASVVLLTAALDAVGFALLLGLARTLL